ncbi:hypothetical protein [Rummeliibacillus sp. TYF005]|nr:hypothetical protein [Rummeliibacillus sp. TYF005]
MQLAFLCYPGWSDTHLKAFHRQVIKYIAQQINVPATVIDFYIHSSTIR